MEPIATRPHRRGFSLQRPPAGFCRGYHREAVDGISSEYFSLSQNVHVRLPSYENLLSSLPVQARFSYSKMELVSIRKEMGSLLHHIPHRIFEISTKIPTEREEGIKTVPYPRQNDSSAAEEGKSTWQSTENSQTVAGTGRRSVEHDPESFHIPNDVSIVTGKAKPQTVPDSYGSHGFKHSINSESTSKSSEPKRRIFQLDVVDKVSLALNDESITKPGGSREKVECPTCGLQLCRKSYLKDHLLVHSRERPFVCSKRSCKKSFRWRSNLTRHFKSHGS